MAQFFIVQYFCIMRYATASAEVLHISASMIVYVPHCLSIEFISLSKQGEKSIFDSASYVLRKILIEC